MTAILISGFVFAYSLDAHALQLPLSEAAVGAITYNALYNLSGTRLRRLA